MFKSFMMYYMEKKAIKLMKANAFRINYNTRVKFNKEEVLSVNEKNELVPYSVDCTYSTFFNNSFTLKPQRKRVVTDCKEIVLNLHTIYYMAKRAKNNPIDYLERIIDAFVWHLSRKQDPAWKKEII